MGKIRSSKSKVVSGKKPDEPFYGAHGNADGSVTFSKEPPKKVKLNCNDWIMNLKWCHESEQNLIHVNCT